MLNWLYKNKQELLLPSCFVNDANHPIAIIPLLQADFQQWLATQDRTIQNWLITTKFNPIENKYAFLPDAEGNLQAVLLLLIDQQEFWPAGNLPKILPAQIYYFNAEKVSAQQLKMLQLAWGLGAYQFIRYKTETKQPAQLLLNNNDEIAAWCQMVYQIRDWINTPAEDMSPQILAGIAKTIAKKHGAKIKIIEGEKLLTENFPLIHAVGRASTRPPLLIDMHWGESHHPKITLTGKGVCFDSGGMDIKNSAQMLLMRKDMGGAAHALGLADYVMQQQLPLQLRLLIPAVDNVIAGNAIKPGDIVRSRKGINVEIGNTDAEGRLIIADCLAAASEEKPELIIDFTTLTGAARVALGPDIPAVFINNDPLAEELMLASQITQEAMWRMPLYAEYQQMIETKYADINNVSESGYAGAIIAGLFLQKFVAEEIPWIHFDLFAWNLADRPGRPQGGEAQTLRAVYELLRKKSRK